MSKLPSQGGIRSMATGKVEVMDLTEDSMLERQQHEAVLLDLEAKKRAFAVDVPTLPQHVRIALRGLGLPVRLFGENLADIRNRLRMELAKREILLEGGMPSAGATDQAAYRGAGEDKDEEQVTKYTRASPELTKAREQISQFSLERARNRLSQERNRRMGSKRKRSQLVSVTTTSLSSVIPSSQDEVGDEFVAEIQKLDDECSKLYKSIRNMALEGSQYGDTRALSALCTSRNLDTPLIATASWSGTIKIWNGSSPQLDLIVEKTMAHEDRIMNIAMNPTSDMVATASIELTAKLWSIRKPKANVMTDDDNADKAAGVVIDEVATLRGHQARLSNVAFHPMGAHVATTSFDHSWRLWDIESGGTELLLQDGHARETYGIGFHPDGSLCSTTDFGGVIQVWDLRTGKSIHHFTGHARRVLCSEFSPNGFQLATAGDDGTIKIWDLRKRKQAASIPAHSNLITQLRFANSTNNGEYIASSSFDGTAKLWSTRDWKLLSTLRGHEGKVMSIDVLTDGVVTCGYDKTLKLWS